LRIDGSAPRHAISEDIYGMNFADAALAAELRLPVRRWGGNATTRYNWRTSLSNKGSDWYFENLHEGAVNVAALPTGSASDQFVDQDRRTGTRSLLSVPLIGWTAKATSPRSHPYDCAFKVSRYGAQQSVDPWDPDCGNGLRADGSQIAGNAPADTSDPADAAFVTAWVNHLVSRYGSAANGGVAYYNLDNEPMLWNSTHRDVHPQPATYDEMRDRTYQFAAAVKAGDPSAKTLGPVLWGWCAYFYSALDNCAPGTDYQSHGNLPFVPWYLGQMKAYEQAHGQRILDYLDLHYYPQASGVALSTAGGTATQALRLRATRSLWDDTYLDESWISDTATGGVKVRLIPRMKDWVNAYYPGTKLAITEYNWGGLESLNGALAQAEVLGVFGREGLDLATLWSPPSASQPGAHAFRMFRNYDGAGHGFGETSLAASSSDAGQLSVFAAERSSDRAITLLVINKSANDLTSPVAITGIGLPATAAVYRYSAANPSAILRLPDQAVGAGGFTASFPANSLTLFAMAPAGTATLPLTVTRTGPGTGSVAASPGTLTWTGSTGTASYAAGTAVALSASAGTGSSFGGWTGCDSSSGSACAVTLTAARSVSAAFTLNQYALTATATGTGTGSVSASIGGIAYAYPAANAGSASLPYGTAVILTATGSGGSTVAWTGCDSVGGTSGSRTCNIASLATARTVTATFTAAACAYTLSPRSQSFTAAGGSGTIAVTASAATCAWTAQSPVAWVSLGGTGSAGSTSLSYSVQANRTGTKRSASLTVAGKAFTVTQSK
jgi:hypothetical protein